MPVAFLVTETFYHQGTTLSKDDHQIAIDLWDNVINPACLEFEEKTGKPAEAMREAIAGVIAKQVRQRSSWNAWQKLWWQRHPKVYDGSLWSKSATSYDFPLD